MLSGLAGAVLLGLVAAAYPAWRAASTDVAAALRYQ
jgi:ABC-type lipoprotein release transport system permease subunit